ncbi:MULTISPECIES: hypothetical protein [Pseudomonas]|uniref:hypothetical protein n=1 Tax=Pseudomonas TaxID=286 RepID=UPI0003142437|nr:MULTISPECIES: hypothetical protein [Pseudomonas putida group]KPM66849.1 hypothetical protein HB4184_02925 [Pseudomonas putida]
MNSIHSIQSLQLRLIESASVSESCASDLMMILRKLSTAEATSVVGIISLLHSEAGALRKIAKDITQRYTALSAC